MLTLLLINVEYTWYCENSWINKTVLYVRQNCGLQNGKQDTHLLKRNIVASDRYLYGVSSQLLHP